MVMYTLNLLGRNIRNAIKPRDPQLLKSFKEHSNNMVIYYAVVLGTGIITFPIIKTFIDMVSRQFITKQTISNFTDALAKIEPEDFDKSVDTLLSKAEQTAPQSISSVEFIANLKRLKKGNPLVEWTNSAEKEQVIREAQTAAIKEYMQAPHNNGKATQHMILASFETPAIEFVARVKKVVARLENTFFGDWKVEQVKKALKEYESVSTPENKQGVKNTLALQRMISSAPSPTQSEKEVADWSVTIKR